MIQKMKLNPNDALTGTFISLTPEERDAIYSMLEEEEYTQDDAGIKKFLLDACDIDPDEEEDFDIRNVRETATDRVLGKMQEYVVEHPELVAQAKSLAGNIGKALGNRMKKKKAEG